MNYRELPDAPESVKHWSGHDPANPPVEDDEGLTPQEQEENYWSDVGEDRYQESFRD
jgi:hypothetical protein